jgi:ubiquinone/menaquinone biosynthesis C-methylase UbiE
MNIHDNIAERYDEDFAGLMTRAKAEWEAQILATVPPRDHRRVLDIAAGTGVSLSFLENQWGELDLAAIDISAKMLEIAGKRLKSPVRCVCDNALHAERHFAPESMDLILGQFLYSHVPPTRVFASAFRILRPGGHFSVVTPTKDQFEGMFEGPRALAGKVLRAERGLKKLWLQESHEHNLALLRAAGFEIVAEKCYRHPFVIPDEAAFWDFSFRAGWLMAAYEQKFRSKLWLARALGKVLVWINPDIFPISAAVNNSLVIARKPNPATARA